jgi:hypothetical protein
MKSLASAIVLIADTSATADGAPGSDRERRAERRETRVEVLRIEWARPCVAIRRLRCQATFASRGSREYMARRDGSLSSVARLAGRASA